MIANFRESDLPALYRAADASSLSAQRWFLRATSLRLVALVGAAFFGLFAWTFAPSPTDWAGVGAAICFFAALLVEGYLLREKLERTWYEGRAAAESVRTLSWRYMMRAKPFDGGQGATPDAVFVSRLNDVLEVLRDIDLVADNPAAQQITSTMRAIREAPLTERKEIYESHRVREQQDWYSRKARWNRDRAVRWTLAMFAVEVTGVVAAVLKATGALAWDLLGLGAAIVASMTAWLQTKQHRTLAAAYSVTVLELASVRSRVSQQQTESDWSTFVSDAEDAFSREHTLWKASRAVRA